MKYIILCSIISVICVLAGSAVTMLVNRRRALSAPVKILLSALFSILLLLSVSLIYVENYYRAEDWVQERLKENSESGPVTVTKIREGYYLDGPGESSAIIFYGGAKVEETAYLPLLYRIASSGGDCFLVKSPFRFAFAGSGAADSILSRYNYPEWYLAGHSMGGVVAANLAASRSDLISGVILLASYPNTKLPEDLRLLSIYGSEDGCLDREAYEKSRPNRPADSTEKIIEGGSHAQFGAYGEQKGDGTASITATEQQNITAETIIEWISLNGPR